MAQVKPASAQVWKRNGHLVRSVLAIVYPANLVLLMDDLMPLASKSTSDTDVAKDVYRHFSRCIDWAYQILHICGPDSDHRIRYSIAAICETMSIRVNAVCRDLGIREDCPTQWSEGYYNADMKQQMKSTAGVPVIYLGVKKSFIRCKHFISLAS
jgi:hypothetical protein